jgi:branched-chain amino acid transport system substrate-binding protein
MNKVTKIILSLVVIFLVAGIWYGVKKKQKLIPLPEKKETIKIGYLAVLSGPVASAWGFYGENAAKMALEEINEKGKIKLEIVWGDSAAKAEKGVTEFKRLCEFEKPDVLMVDGSAVASAIAPLANQYQKPVIFGAVAVEGITKQSEFLFRNFYRCSQTASLLAESAFKKIGIKKVAIIFPKDPYGESCAKEFEEKFKSLGGETVAKESFLPNDVDFRTQLAKIKTKDPQAIYIVGYERALGNIVKQMKELKIEKTILGENVLYAPDVRDEIIKNTNPPEVYFTSTFFYLGSEKAKKFSEKFEAKYKRKPALLAAFVYDTLYMIEKAAEISKEKKIPIKDVLKEVEIEGVVGKLKFNENRETETKMEFVKLNKDGSLTLVK